MAELKQKQKFEGQWKRLLTLTGEPTPEKVSKVPQSDIIAMFKEIATERIEKARLSFKTKLTAILEAKQALDKNLQKGRLDLEQKEEKEYEALNKELNEGFSMLDNVKNINNNLVEAASGNFSNENVANESENQQENLSEEVRD